MEFLVNEALETANKIKTIDEDFKVGQANIKVIGIGGGGSNTTDWLFKKGVKGAEICAMNTDKQHLDITEADKKILLGKELTRGLGAGGYPNVGMESAKESMHEIRSFLKDADMVFICAGMGGGTGTGAAPVVAQIAKETGAIVIGTVTMPLQIEKARIDKAELGLEQLRDNSDTVIVIANDRLVRIAGNLPVQQAFAVANELMSTMIKSIVEVIAVPSLVNLDYADVKAIMRSGGVSVIGLGESESDRRVEEAVKRALTNPLLDVTYDGASGALIHITGGDDLTLDEVDRVGQLVTEALDADATVMWGARISESMKGKLRVMTIVTGVTSPFVLGKVDYGKPSAKEMRISNELGIDLIR